MKTKATSLILRHNEHNQPLLTLTLDMSREQSFAEVDKLRQIIRNGKELSVEIKQYRKKKSQSANSYCWVLCQKIAEAIGSTKELVYQKFVKEVGRFEIMSVRPEAVERWIYDWCNIGLGWFAEVIGVNGGRTDVMCYFGSSSYNSKEMSVLIDEIVSQAQELGIETKSDNEIKSLLEQWEVK